MMNIREYRQKLENRVFKNKVKDIGILGDPILKEGLITIILKDCPEENFPQIGDTVYYRHNQFQTSPSPIYAELYTGSLENIQIVDFTKKQR